MTETHRINSQLKRAQEGQAWHGPSLRELLDGVTAEQAAARPIPNAHSIWELVNHINKGESNVSKRSRPPDFGVHLIASRAAIS
jgi:hypothetical protein